LVLHQFRLGVSGRRSARGVGLLGNVKGRGRGRYLNVSIVTANRRMVRKVLSLGPIVGGGGWRRDCAKKKNTTRMVFMKAIVKPEGRKKNRRI